MNNLKLCFPIILILTAIFNIFASSGEPITIDIPVTVREDPIQLVGFWDKCLGNYQGDIVQHCEWVVATGATAYDTLWIYQRREGCGIFSGEAEKRVTILEFNTTDIPDTAYISDVSLILTVDSIYNSAGAPPQIECSDMLANETRPSERLLDVTNLTDALGGNLGNKDYLSGTSVTSTGEFSAHLNNDAKTDLQNKLGDNWFALGLNITNFTESSGTALVRLTPRAFQKIRVTYYSSTNITVQTDFPDGELIIDDSLRVVSPHIAEWYEDELHVINTDSIQTPGLGVKYLYRYWSDGIDSIRHTIHISSDTLVYTAYFDTMYQLTIYAPGYTEPSPVDPDSIWFDPRSWAFISIEPCTVYLRADSLERHIFQGWSGVGSGSYSGPTDTAWVQMNEPVNQYALYDTAFWLELTYDGCGTGVPAQIGEGWAYASDSVEVITAESLFVEDAWYFFTYWSNSAGHLRDSTSARTWFIDPDLPRTIVANYSVDPQLQVYPDSLSLIAPGHEFLLPVIIDASIDYAVDSFGFVMHFDNAKLEFIDLIRSSVIWAELTPTAGDTTVSVFGDVPGSSMLIEAPETLFYYRMRAKLGATGRDTISFDGFEHAFELAETRPGYVQIVPLEISISVTNDYGGDSVWIDGTPYPAPYEDTWIGADIHEIGTDTLNPISLGVHARFTGWSDGGARFHNVRPINDSSFVAQFDTMLYLDIVSPFAVAAGSGWFDRGEERGFSVSPEIVTDGLSRDIFISWEGTGGISYTGTDNPAICTMMSPIIETAIWQHQYWLELHYSGTGGAVPSLIGEGWSDDLSWTHISTDSIIDDGGTPRYFSWWSGGTVANRFIRSTEAYISLPDTIIAVYSNEPFVFNFDIPETTIAAPSSMIEIPVAIDIPTSTVLSEISFNLYFDNNVLDYSGINLGDLSWTSITGTDLSSGANGHVLVHASATSPLSVDPSDILANLNFNVSPSADGVSDVIAADGGHDIAVASPDTGLVNVIGPVSVVVSTSPIDGVVIIDSTNFSAPYESDWHSGDSILVAVPTPQYPATGVRMAFFDWSDGGALEHSVFPTTDTIYIANFEIAYLFNVISAWGVSSGSGWYASGAEAIFDVSPDSIHDGSSYYLFSGWVGDGDSAYTGPLNASLARIYEPCSETAQWNAFHELSIDYSGSSVAPTLTGEGWFMEGVPTPITAQDSIDDGPDRYYFLYWDGPSAIGDRFSSNTTVALSEPTELTAVYSVEHGNSIFGPPSLTLAESGSFILLPIIFHGSSIDADSLSFEFDFDIAGISPNSIISGTFGWEILEITDDGFTATVFACNSTEFTIEDGDTIANIVFHVSGTSGLYSLDFEAPAFDLSDCVPIDGNVRISGAIEVMVQTDFGGKVYVDGSIYDSPYEAEWIAGSEHQIFVPELQNFATGHRKYYDSWSDAGLRSHYVIPISDTTFTAFHDDKYAFDVLSRWGATIGSGWYLRGEEAIFSVSPENVTVSHDRYSFNSWAGTGVGSYSGGANPHSITIRGPARETAQWNSEHYLSLESTGTGGASPILTGQGWYESGTWAPITASPTVLDPARALNPRSFSHWSGGVFADENSPSTTVLVDSAFTATANYMDAAIDATDSLWIAVGGVANIAVRAISNAPLDLDTIEMSITFGGDILTFVDVTACGIAWDYLNAEATPLGGGVIRVGIDAYRDSPFEVEDFDRLFCVNMEALSVGTAPFELSIERVNSPDFKVLNTDRAVKVSDLVDLTLASPVADSLFLDGTAYAVGTIIHLASGSPHIATAPLILPDTPDSRFIFSQWDDHIDAARDIRPISDTTITARYTAQYKLNIFSDHAVITGSGWFDESDTAIFAVTPDSIMIGDSIIYLFSGWVGDYIGIENPCSTVIDEAKNITAVWDTLYRVNVESAHATPETDGWCAVGDSIILKIRPIVVDDGLNRWTFMSWSGTGTGSYSGTSDSLLLYPASPIHEIAEWSVQHFVRIFNGGHGTSEGGGWYNEGDTAWFGISPMTVDSTTDIRWSFAGWNGEGDGAYSGSVVDTFCTVNEAFTETASWSLEYLLTVDNGGHGAATGAGWYTDGDTAEFSVEPDSEIIVDGKAWRFTGWTGTGSGEYTGENNPAICRMGGPIEEIANWGIRFRVTITDSGASGIPEFEGEGWFSATSWQPICAPPVVIAGSSRLSFLHWSGGVFEDTTSHSTNVRVDTTLYLTAHYSDFEISPPETILVEAGDTFDVPITLYNPFAYRLMNMQFNINFPDSILDFVSVRSSSDFTWNTINATPMGFGLITIYGNRTPSYVTTPAQLCIAKFVSTGSSARIDTISLNGFSYDIAGANSNPAMLIIGAPIDVVVRSDYSGPDAKVWIDGAQNASPYEGTWIAGEPHSIGAFNSYGSSDTRSVWRSWSDGGAIHHVVAPMLEDTFTAHYEIEHKLTISAPYGEPFGEGFHSEGTEVEFGLAEEVVATEGTEYTFDLWTGIGDGNYSGTNNPALCTMNAPITETASYVNRYFLEIDGVYSASTGEGWYSSGSPAEFSIIDTIIDVTPGTRRTFDRWAGAYTGTDNPATWIVTSTNTETAQWLLEHLVTIETPRGIPTGDGWNISGDSVEISIEETIDSTDGIRWAFAGWEIGDTTYLDNTYKFVLIEPTTITALWEIEYRLDVVSDHGLPGDEGWYSEDEIATISVEPETVIVGQIRFIFQGWTGTGVSSYTGLDNPHNIIMTAPIIETAEWKTQYYLTVDGGPSDALGDGWYNHGANAIFSVVDPVIESDGVRWAFSGWSGFGAGAYTGAGNPAGCNLNGPILETAKFDKLYLVNIQSDHGTVYGEGYYIEGSIVPFYVEPESIITEGILYNFDSWIGSGPGSYTGPNNPSLAIPDSANEETANWDTLFLLTLDAIGCPAATPALETEGFYREGNIPISAENPVYSGTDRYHFRKWTGGIFADSLSSTTNISLTGPDTAIAQYSSLEVSPAESIFCSADDTVWIPIILYQNTPIYWLDSIGFDIYYDSDMLTYYDLSEDPDVDWESKVVVPISRTTDSGLRIRAYTSTLFNIVPPDTILYVGFIVSSGFVYSSPIEIRNRVLDLDLSGTIDGVVLKDNLVSVTVENAIFGDSVIVDGTTYLSPYSSNWIPGHSHTISAKPFVSTGIGSRAKFDFWSDGGTISRIVYAESETSFTANFTQQFSFTVFNSGGDSPVPPLGAHWFDVGTTVSAFVRNPDPITNWFCTGYYGTGNLFLGGTQDSVDFDLTQATSIRWNWQEMVPLIVISDYGTPWPPVGTTWVAPGTVIDAVNDSLDIIGPGVAWRCESYTGSGSASSGDGFAVSFTIEELSQLEWAFEGPAYALNLAADGCDGATPDIIEAEGFYLDEATITASYSVLSGGVKYFFDHWASIPVGATFEDEEDSSTSINLIGSPRIAVAHYVRGVRLELYKSPVEPFGGFAVGGENFDHTSHAIAWLPQCWTGNILSTSQDTAVGGDSMFVFDSWSDGGARVHFVGPICENTIFTSYMNKKYRYKFTKEPSWDVYGTIKVGSTTFSGAASVNATAWLEEGETFQISASEFDLVDPTRRLKWISWSDGGALMHNIGPIDGPDSLNASYLRQFALTVRKNPLEEYGWIRLGAIYYNGVSEATAWYDIDASAEIEVSDPDGYADTLWNFADWDIGATTPSIEFGPIDTSYVLNANYSEEEVILSFNATPESWDVGNIELDFTETMSARENITLANNGTHSLVFGLNVEDMGPWTVGYISGIDKFSLKAQFNDLTTPPLTWSTFNDAVLNYIRWANDEAFGVGGINIEPSSSEYLWLSFTAPHSSLSYGAQTLNLKITGYIFLP